MMTLQRFTLTTMLRTQNNVARLLLFIMTCTIVTLNVSRLAIDSVTSSFTVRVKANYFQNSSSSSLYYAAYSLTNTSYKRRLDMYMEFVNQRFAGKRFSSSNNNNNAMNDVIRTPLSYYYTSPTTDLTKGDINNRSRLDLFNQIQGVKKTSFGITKLESRPPGSEKNAVFISKLRSTKTQQLLQPTTTRSEQNEDKDQSKANLTVYATYLPSSTSVSKPIQLDFIQVSAGEPDALILQPVAASCLHQRLGDGELVQLQRFLGDAELMRIQKLVESEDRQRQARTTAAASHRVPPAVHSKLANPTALRIYRYFVNDNSITFATDCLRLVLVESVTTNNVTSFTTGGSSFVVRATSERKLITCPVTDTFTGEYIVHCPTYDEPCVNVTVKKAFDSFTAFRNPSPRGTGLKALAHIVWSRQVCRHKVSLADRSTQTHQSKTSYTGWYRQNSKLPWYWVDATLGTYQPISDKDIARCLDRVKVPVYFVGDSHLRGMFYYLLHFVGALIKDLATEKIYTFARHRNFQYNFTGIIPNQKTKFATFFPTVYDVLQKINATISQNRFTSSSTRSNYVEGVLVMCAGTWDATIYPATHFITDVLPVMGEFVRFLRQSGYLRRLKVIFVTPPAVYNEESWGKTNAKTAALNRLLVDHMMTQLVNSTSRDGHLTIIDYYAATSGLYERADKDGFHYHAFPPRNNSVGQSVVKVLLREVCKAG